MALTAAQWQRLIITETRLEQDPLNADVPLFWDAYSDRASIAPRLQYLYAKRAVIDARLGRRWDDHDVADDGLEESVQQQIKNLQAQRDDCTAEIEVIEARAGSVQAVAVGEMTTDSPFPRDLNFVNPNSRRLHGDPIKRQFGFDIL